jgi:hypothetical protein
MLTDRIVSFDVYSWETKVADVGFRVWFQVRISPHCPLSIDLIVTSLRTTSADLTIITEKYSAYL